MRLLPLSLLTAVALLAVACGSDGSDLTTSVAGQADPTPTAAREVATPESAPAADAEAEPSATPDVDEVVPEQEEAADQDGDVPELYPDVLAAEAEQANGAWSFAVTMSSPYDSPERYADAWRVLAPDGTELGVRILTHDHASEQPFTRSLSGVEIPDDVTTVTIQGHDQVSGWGGATVDVTLDRGES